MDEKGDKDLVYKIIEDFKEMVKEMKKSRLKKLYEFSKWYLLRH